MRVLLTGATGLIGKEVGKQLVEKGHEVTALVRNVERARLDLPFPAKLFVWKDHTVRVPQEALVDVDAVIHLAGEPIAEGRWTEEKKRLIRASRVEGTRRIAEAVRLEGPSVKVFVLGSATGYYGDRGDEALNEVSPLGSDFLAEVVRDWEAEADSLSSESRIRLAKVRTGIVLSRRSGALPKMLPVFTKGLGGKLGNGQQWMSWIHIEDIARVFVFCAENENASGVFNGTAPEPARNDRFTISLARALGRPVFLPVPETALKTALGEVSTAVLASQRVLPERLQELGFQFHYPQLVPALEELCQPLKDGQHELVAEQWIPRKPEDVFPYFCSEKNLEELTPPFLNFRVIGKSTKDIEQGTLIDYRLSLHGVPMKWRTLIESWQPGQSFVDTQLKGPYRKWHHTHEFLSFGGGTLLRDRVLYKLPLGLFGDTVAGWKVSQDVQKIFKFRRQKIDELFGSKV